MTLYEAIHPVAGYIQCASWSHVSACIERAAQRDVVKSMRLSRERCVGASTTQQKPTSASLVNRRIANSFSQQSSFAHSSIRAPGNTTTSIKTMKSGAFLYAVLLAAAAVQTYGSQFSLKASLNFDGSSSDLEPFTSPEIPHSHVRPIAQPEPTTEDQKTAIRFKPQIKFVNGCHSYPAVNGEGEHGGGLKPTGAFDGDCAKPTYGSQIYGRAIVHKGKLCIIYALYFPKEMSLSERGHRHDFRHVAVWTDDPEREDDPAVLAVSVWTGEKYVEMVPPGPEFMDGDSVQLKYMGKDSSGHTLSFTEKVGKSLPLIMWDQLDKKPLSALETVDWDKTQMPLKDSEFMKNVERSWPFDTAK